jgi:hypothetical protein
MSETKLKEFIILLSLLSITVSYALFMNIKDYNNHVTSSKVKIDSLTNIVDSLDNENFINRTDNIRHEISRDYFFHHHPNLEKEYNDFYLHETE